MIRRSIWIIDGADFEGLRRELTSVNWESFLNGDIEEGWIIIIIIIIIHSW